MNLKITGYGYNVMLQKHKPGYNTSMYDKNGNANVTILIQHTTRTQNILV